MVYVPERSSQCNQGLPIPSFEHFASFRVVGMLISEPFRLFARSVSAGETVLLASQTTLPILDSGHSATR